MKSRVSGVYIEHFFDVNAAFRVSHRIFACAGRWVSQDLFVEKDVFRLLGRKTVRPERRNRSGASNGAGRRAI